MCTGIRLKADNGAIIYARTLEFAQDINSEICILPRGYHFTGTTLQGKDTGLQWETRYAVVGANACHEIGVIDGVNERGLAGGLFYFSNYAQYQPMNDASKTIAPWELITYILTTCTTVEQVRALLPNITVTDVLFEPWQSSIPLHALVHDSSGKSLVIEYVQGKLTLHDDPLGIITNAPTFDWHITNLDNYLNLSPYNPAFAKASAGTHKSDTQALPLGQGSGMLGLPGDFTSPSRFVRAVAFSTNVVDIPTESAARDAAFHLLNLFDIPHGSIREQEDHEIIYERTQWTSCVDLRNKRYYWHTYATRQLQMVDLMQCSLNAQQPVIIPMEAQDIIVDRTP